MTNEEKAKIVELLSLQAEIAGRNFSPPALFMLVESLADLPFDGVQSTLTHWSKSNRGFPHPADVRAKLMPELDDQDDAQTVASLIVSAVSKCGYTNPDRARERVGELGWAVVEQSGGWKHLCETMTIDNESIMKAQLRDLAKTVSKRAKRGELNTPPGLPTPSNVTSIINNTMKALGLDHE